MNYRNYIATLAPGKREIARLLNGLGECVIICAQSAMEGIKLSAIEVIKMAAEIIKVTVVLLGVFLGWPVVQALLWNWSEHLEMVTLVHQIAQRGEWLMSNREIVTLSSVFVVIRCLWRGASLIIARP